MIRTYPSPGPSPFRGGVMTDRPFLRCPPRERFVIRLLPSPFRGGAGGGVSDRRQLLRIVERQDLLALLILVRGRGGPEVERVVRGLRLGGVFRLDVADPQRVAVGEFCRHDLPAVD